MSMSAAQFWSRHLAAVERDGVSIAEYARRHDLSAQSLYGWRRRSRLTAQADTTEQHVRFAEVITTHSTPRSGLLLRLGDATLEFDDLPEPGWVASLLGAINAR